MISHKNLYQGIICNCMSINITYIFVFKFFRQGLNLLSLSFVIVEGVFRVQGRS